MKLIIKIKKFIDFILFIRKEKRRQKENEIVFGK